MPNSILTEYASGDKAWYLNDQLHREDGPALEYATGTKEWWLNGNRHRTDGPAIEMADGYKSWWLNDNYITDDPLVWMVMQYESQLTSSHNPV